MFFIVFGENKMTEEMGIFIGLITVVVGAFMMFSLVTAIGARSKKEEEAGYGCFNFFYSILVILGLLVLLTALFSGEGGR